MKALLTCLFVWKSFAAFDRAEIQTCSGCKLNRLADVRLFVMNEFVGALSYKRVSRKFISGHNPDLVFYNGNTEAQRIDMTPLSLTQLQQLMKENGFTKLADKEL